MSKLWVYGPSIALGSEKIDVVELLEEHGPVRPDFLDKTGFRTLYATPDDVSALDLAVDAIDKIGDDWWREHVDGLVHVSSTSTLTAPGNAHLLQARLGLKKETFVLDINDACTGFVRALAVVEALIGAGLARTVLLVAADTYTKLYDASELKVSPLFSDGASVLLISAAPLSNVPEDVVAREWEIVASTFRSEGDHAADLCITPDAKRESGHLTMNGGAVYTFVLRNIAEVVQDLTRQAGSLEGVSWYVHQGSRTVVTAVEKVVSAEPGSLFRSAEYGNVVQSSIPFQLADSSTEESTIGFLGFGVGLTIAGAIVKQRRV